jgi:hypothetical protein
MGATSPHPFNIRFFSIFRWILNLRGGFNGNAKANLVNYPTGSQVRPLPQVAETKTLPMQDANLECSQYDGL